MTTDVLPDLILPPGWIHRVPAEDLDLAVLLVNSLDLMEDPPDRLAAGIGWYTRALRAAGHGDLADGLRDEDLQPLKELRAMLRLVFTADTIAEAMSIINPMLVRSGAVPVLTLEGGRPVLRVAPGTGGFAALQARLPAAAAALIAESELRRLGTCAGVPCECAYVDRSRSGSRRFCSDWCNDRAAAAAYRRRRKMEPGVIAGE